MNMDNKVNIPKWLKELQDNSWEIEILISGGAIFSLIQFSNFFMNWSVTLNMSSTYPGMAVFIMIVVFSIKILIIGFMLHLLLRAFWLALLCVNFVYPQGIDKNKINQKKPFTFSSDLFDLKSQIMKIDSYCASIMYLSIISFVAILGLLFSFFVLIFLTLGVSELLWSVFLVFFILYVIDFITFSFIRKIPYLSYLLFPFFKLFDFLSFRIIFQKSLWMMNTNINKIKFTIGMISFLMFAGFLTYLSIYKTMHWPNMFDSRTYRWEGASSTNDLYMKENLYMDNWDKEIVSRGGISSKVQTGNLLEVFVTYRASMDELIEMTSDIDSLKRFDKIMIIKVNDSLYQNVEWVFTRKLNESLYGITTMLPIENLKNGLHRIKVYTDYTKQSQKEIEEQGNRLRIDFEIPFWVDRQNN